MKHIPFKSGRESVPNINKIQTVEIQQSKTFIIIELIKYSAKSVVEKSIIKKATGNLSLLAFDTGEEIKERILPYDTFAQILHGKAEIIINGISHILKSGQSIIIPAHLTNAIKSNERFKMMLTTIKPQPRKNNL